MKISLRKKVRQLVVCCTICFICSAYGQEAFYINSLNNTLSHAKTDTEKINTLLLLSEAFSDTSVAKGIYYANEALTLSDKIHWAQGRMYAEFDIGNCYSNVAIYDKAINHFKASLALSQQIHRADQELICLFHIAESYNDANDIEESFVYKKSAIELAHRLKDINTECQETGLLASGLKNLGRYQEAITYWQRSLILVDTARRKDMAAGLLNNLASAYIKINKTDSALLYLRRALQLNQETDDSETRSAILMTQCEVYFANKVFDSAFKYCQQAYTLAIANNNLEVLQFAYKMFSKIYEFTKQPQKALASYKSYDSVTILINNEQKTIEEAKQILEIDFDKKTQVYRLEKKSFEDIKHNQQIALNATVLALIAFILLTVYIYWNMMQENKKNKTISRQSQQLQLQNETIENTLKEKEILLKEVHHRVKNNLQIISSLLELQSEHVDDENAKMALGESQARVISMAIIHQKLYQNENLHSLDFCAFADDLFIQMKNLSGNRLKTALLVNEIPEKYFEIDVAIPLGLILNELITNSFKYALPKSGLLKVILSLSRMDDYYVLKYSDNGQGLPKDINLELNQSLGLQLVNKLSHQLGGYAKYIYEDGPNFYIYFVEF